MKMKNLMIVCVFVAAMLIPVIWGFAIDWIQYNERVVGENSPLYSDVVNRPGKQIWQNFTSEHTLTGAHKPGAMSLGRPFQNVTGDLLLSDADLHGQRVLNVTGGTTLTLPSVATVTTATFPEITIRADASDGSRIILTPNAADCFRSLQASETYEDGDNMEICGDGIAIVQYRSAEGWYIYGDVCLQLQ